LGDRPQHSRGSRPRRHRQQYFFTRTKFLTRFYSHPVPPRLDSPFSCVSLKLHK
jgi:hypothetical protein